MRLQKRKKVHQKKTGKHRLTRRVPERKKTKQSTGSAETVNSSEVHTVIGTLEELSMDQVVLLSDNGNELAFSTDDVKIDLPYGIRIGNLVSVDYTGKITQKGTKRATAVRIADRLMFSRAMQKQKRRRMHQRSRR